MLDKFSFHIRRTVNNGPHRVKLKIDMHWEQVIFFKIGWVVLEIVKNYKNVKGKKILKEWNLMN